MKRSGPNAKLIASAHVFDLCPENPDLRFPGLTRNDPKSNSTLTSRGRWESPQAGQQIFPGRSKKSPRKTPPALEFRVN